MKHRRVVLSRRHGFAVGGAALLCASLVVMAGPAGASCYGHASPRAGGAVPAVVGNVSVTPSNFTFPAQRAGTYSGIPKTVTVANTGSVAVTISEIFATTNDYFGSTTCFDHPTLAVNASCTITNFFFPNAAGTRPAILEIVDNASGSPQKVALTGQGVEGYYLAGAHGEVANFGDAQPHGDATNVGLKAPIISIKTTSNGEGYWLLGTDGGIFSYGNAAFYGSTGGIHLNQPVVGMERTVGGKGYWLVARDGGIFSFGDAKFFGSTGAIHLNQPIVGMVARPNGLGYWLDASDGGIFSFGDAQFFGSSTGRTSAVAATAATPDGKGYWQVSDSGIVFNYGNAPALGDIPGADAFGAGDVVGIAPSSPSLPLDFLS
jgi:hypothetical protein